MIEAIRHFGIVVNDLDASLLFYKKYFGFEIEKDAHEKGSFIEQVLAKDGVELRTVKLLSKASEVMVELISFLKGNIVERENRINYLGPTHFALTVREIEEKYENMQKNGVDFLSPPLISPDGSVKVAFCQAPEGTYIEMVELQS